MMAARHRPNLTNRRAAQKCEGSTLSTLEKAVIRSTSRHLQHSSPRALRLTRLKITMRDRNGNASNQSLTFDVGLKIFRDRCALQAAGEIKINSPLKRFLYFSAYRQASVIIIGRLMRKAPPAPRRRFVCVAAIVTAEKIESTT